MDEANRHQGWLDENGRDGTSAVPGAEPAEVFLQYKNTAACLDFTCGDCGRSGHFDGEFAYVLRCACGATYEMPPLLYPRRVEMTGDGGPVIDLESGDSGPATG